MDDHSYSRAASRPKSIIFADQIFAELPPEDSTGSPKSKKPQLGHCGLIECQNKGHCRGWHCPLCYRTGPRYRVKNHVYSVHWASRVVVGGINSLLCKCKIPGKVTPRHWHCPYCACNPYYKLKYLVSHIVRTHKPNAVVKGYSQQRLVYSVDCTRSEADVNLTADEHSFDTNDLRTDSWTPKRKALPKDFSFLGTHGCEVVRCKEPGHCRGWHCSLCPAAAPKYRIRNHLATVHWASRIEIGDKVSVMCKCNKAPNSAPRHWHCPFCVIKCLRPKKMIRHIMDVHKPDEVVKRFSFGKPHGFFSRSDDGIQKVEEEEEVVPETVKTPMPNCEVIRCIGQGHCKGWHCPYCSATGLRYLMKSHLQSVHWASRIEFDGPPPTPPLCDTTDRDDKTSVLCKCNNFNNKITPRHWHCPLCTDVTFAKSIRLLHHILTTHKPLTSVKRYCQGRLMTNVSQITSVESPKRRDKPPSYSESLVYNGVGCDIIWCDRDAHCDGWHCPFCTANGKRYLMKRHLQAVHWASRVEAGEMKSVLCKCPLTKLKDQRHYHCPLCTNLSFTKPASLQKHILRVHKPTADVKQYSRNQVINVMEAKPAIDAIMTSEEATGAVEAMGTVEATEASEATETIEAAEMIEATETMEVIVATEVIEATEAMKVMEAIQNDVQPIIKKHEDRQIDWDMIKCTVTDHCEGWHCSLCIMTGDIPKLKQHFSANHWGSRVEVGDLAIVTCKCRKVSGLGHHHWHCPLCINRSFSRIVTLEDHFVYTHKPNAEVKRFSRGNLVTTNDYTTNLVGSTQPKLEYGVEQTYTDAPPPVQDCSVLKCEVEGHCVGWHCPFCSATGEKNRMKNHIQAVHWGSRVEIGESWSVLCKCKSTGKTTPRHWHCTLCTNSTFVKAQILETHMIRIHKVEENIKRFSRSKLVAVNGVVVTGNVVEVSCDAPLAVPDAHLDTSIEDQQAMSVVHLDTPVVHLDSNVVNLDSSIVHIVTPDDADVAVEEIIAFTDAWEMLQKELQ